MKQVKSKCQDYVFRFLVEKIHQFSLFNDEGQPANIDEPWTDEKLYKRYGLSPEEIAFIDYV